MNHAVTDWMVRRARKANQLQFAVLTAVIGLLLAILLNRVLFYQEMAEKIAFETNAINMRTGLRYRVAELMLHQRESDIGLLVGSNPGKWLDRPLPNYGGEVNRPNWDALRAGYWYFDKYAGELVYKVQRSRYFVPGPSGQRCIRYRVTGFANRIVADDKAAPVEGVTLTLVEPYQWF